MWLRQLKGDTIGQSMYQAGLYLKLWLLQLKRDFLLVIYNSVEGCICSCGCQVAPGLVTTSNYHRQSDWFGDLGWRLDQRLEESC